MNSISSNFDAQILPKYSRVFPEKYEYRQNLKFSEADLIHLSEILKHATCNSKGTNWMRVLDGVLIAREIALSSIDAWKLCARAEITGGYVDAALDCILEAMYVDRNDREANTILHEIVEERLNKSFKVRLFKH